MEMGNPPGMKPLWRDSHSIMIDKCWKLRQY